MNIQLSLEEYNSYRFLIDKNQASQFKALFLFLPSSCFDANCLYAATASTAVKAAAAAAAIKSQ